jgi:hypothetical protein
MSEMSSPGLSPNGAPEDEGSSLASLWRQARAADKHARQGVEQLSDRAWRGNSSFSQRAERALHRKCEHPEQLLAHNRQLRDSLLHAEAAGGRKEMDVRVAWRDAELFRLSKREQRWTCALFMLCWRMRTAQLTSQNLAVARFQRRKRQTDCKAHLVSWWAVVLLRQRSFASSSLGGASDCSEEEDAACSTNGSARHQANAAEHAANGHEAQNASPEAANALEQQAADFKIIQRCAAQHPSIVRNGSERERVRVCECCSEADRVPRARPVLCIDLTLGGKVWDHARAQPGERYLHAWRVRTTRTNEKMCECVLMCIYCMFLSGMWLPYSKS